jgi:MFS family permease
VALIRDQIKDRQASALSVLAIFSSAMTALGPTLGGFLIVWGDWPAIFWVNYPFVLMSLLLGWFLFPRDDKSEKIGMKNLLSQLDLLGIGFFAAGMVFLLWFLLSFESTIHFLSGVIGVLFFALFFWRELKAEEPFIDIQLFKTHPKLSWVYIQFGLPTYFQEEMKLSVENSGLLMLFMSGMSVIISPITGKWIDKVGVKKPIVVGSFISIIGAVFLTLFFVGANYWVIGFILAVLGLSYGIGNVVLQVAMMNESPKDIVGTTSGLFQTCRYLGSILSSIVLGLIFGKEISTGNMKILGIFLIFTGALSFLMSLKFSMKKPQSDL